MSESHSTEQATEPMVLFDSLFASHHKAIIRYCIRRLGPSEAEDAAADVFAVAWRRLDEVPTGESARAWLIGVAYKVVGNRYRARRRTARLRERLRFESLEPTPTEPDFELQQVHRALEELSSADRELIRLVSWDGLSRSEIAQVLGIRVNTVDQRLHRARGRLKTHFDRLLVKATPPRPKEASL